MKFVLKSAKKRSVFFAAIFLFFSVATNVSAAEANLIELLQRVEARKLSAIDAVSEITNMYLSNAKRPHNFDKLVAEYISFGCIRQPNYERLPKPKQGNYLLRTEPPMTANEMHKFLMLFSAAAVNAADLSEKIKNKLSTVWSLPDAVKYHIKACSVLSRVAEKYTSSLTGSSVDNDKEFLKLVEQAVSELGYRDFKANEFVDSLLKRDHKIGDSYSEYVKKASAKFKENLDPYKGGIDFLQDETNAKLVGDTKRLLIKDIELFLGNDKSMANNTEMMDAVAKLKKAFETKDGIVDALNNAHKLVLQHKVEQASYRDTIRTLGYYEALLYNEEEKEASSAIRDFRDAYRGLGRVFITDPVRDFLVELTKKINSITGKGITGKGTTGKGYENEEVMFSEQLVEAANAATARVRFEFFRKNITNLTKAKNVTGKQLEPIIKGMLMQKGMASRVKKEFLPLVKKMHIISNIISDYEGHFLTEYIEWQEKFDPAKSETGDFMKEVMKLLDDIHTLIKGIKMLDSNNELRPLSDFDKNELNKRLKAAEAALKIFFIPFLSSYKKQAEEMDSRIKDILDGDKIDYNDIALIIKNIKKFELSAISYQAFHDMDGLIGSYDGPDGTRDFHMALRVLEIIIENLTEGEIAREDNQKILKEFLGKLLADKKKTLTSIHPLLEELFDSINPIPESSGDSNLPKEAKALYDLVKENYDNSEYTQNKNDKQPHRGNAYLENYKFSEPSGWRKMDLNNNNIRKDLVFIMFLLDYNPEKIETILSKIKGYKREEYRKNLERPLHKLRSKYSQDRNPKNHLVAQQLNLAIDFLKALLKI